MINSLSCTTIKQVSAINIHIFLLCVVAKSIVGHNIKVQNWREGKLSHFSTKFWKEKSSMWFETKKGPKWNKLGINFNPVLNPTLVTSSSWQICNLWENKLATQAFIYGYIYGYTVPQLFFLWANENIQLLRNFNYFHTHKKILCSNNSSSNIAACIHNLLGDLQRIYYVHFKIEFHINLNMCETYTQKRPYIHIIKLLKTWILRQR